MCFKRFADLCSNTNRNIGKALVIYKRAKVLRHIQLLSTLLNGIQKGPPILAIMCALTVVGSLAFSTLIGNLNSDFKFVATLLLLTIDCLMGMLIILGQMGMVYQKSNCLLRKMQCRHYSQGISIRDQKWEHRFYKSCSPIKIFISSVNFVDQLTPLNCLQLSMTFTANILLLNVGNN